MLDQNLGAVTSRNPGALHALLYSEVAPFSYLAINSVLIQFFTCAFLNPIPRSQCVIVPAHLLRLRPPVTGADSRRFPFVTKPL